MALLCVTLHFWGNLICCNVLFWKAKTVLSLWLMRWNEFTVYWIFHVSAQRKLRAAGRTQNPNVRDRSRNSTAFLFQVNAIDFHIIWTEWTRKWNRFSVFIRWKREKLHREGPQAVAIVTDLEFKLPLFLKWTTNEPCIWSAHWPFNWSCSWCCGNQVTCVTRLHFLYSMTKLQLAHRLLTVNTTCLTFTSRRTSFSSIACGAFPWSQAVAVAADNLFRAKWESLTIQIFPWQQCQLGCASPTKNPYLIWNYISELLE